jgi:predicted metal-dependent HD superfamily phosphohydrolase
MEDQSYLIKQSAWFASATLPRISSSYGFHTFGHTKQVVRAARIIGRASKLTDESLNAVMIAAWFHNVGYADGVGSHEDRSAFIAVKMLKTWEAGSKIVEDVSRCIRAIKFPQDPKDILSMILCDAVVTQLASPQYEMRREEKTLSEREWENHRVCHRRNIELLDSHRYFTEYGKEILDRRKKANLKKMKQQLSAVSIQPLFETSQKLRS